MFQHFLRYVREENGFLFLEHLRCRANERNFGAGLDCGCVRFSIEVAEHAECLSSSSRTYRSAP